MMHCMSSGNIRNFAELAFIGAFLSDGLVPRNPRAKVLISWGSRLASLLH